MNAWQETTKNPTREYEQKTNPSRVSYNEVGISLHVYTHGTYDIWPWDRINTEGKLIDWVYHLSKKTWCDRRLIRDLIELVKTHFGWNARNAWR